MKENLDQIDKKTLAKLLVAVKGNMSQAANVLKDYGYHVSNHKINDWVNQHPEFKNLVAVLIDGDLIAETQALSDIEAAIRPPSLFEADDTTLTELHLAIENKFMMGGLKSLGLTTQESEKMISYMNFAERNFMRTLEFYHTNMFTASFRLAEHADWVRQNKLKNKELSEADRLSWQKEYTKMMAELRKDNEVAHKIMEMRLKANELALGEGSGLKGANRNKNPKPKNQSKADEAILVQAERVPRLAENPESINRRKKL